MHAFRVFVEQDGYRPFEALVCELIPGQRINDLLEQVYKQFESSLRLGSIIIRPSVKWPIDPGFFFRGASVDRSGEVYRYLEGMLFEPDLMFERFAEQPIHILASFNHEIYLTENLNGPQDEGRIPDEILITAIRDAEIDYLVAEGRAKLPRSESILYRAPSGWLMRSFLRVGNMQRSRAALDAIFFWLIPHLKFCAGIVTDTWSISSIAMNASRRLQVYEGNRSAPCPVEMLSQYHDGSDTRSIEAAEIVARLLETEDGRKESPTESGSKVMFLISATHSGTLANNLKVFLEDRFIPLEKVSFVAIFKLGPIGELVSALRDLSVGPESDDFELLSDESQTDRESIVPIDDQVYFPIKYHDVRYKIRKPDAAPVKNFILAYSDHDLFQCHRTVRDDTGQRHHAIWVDTEKLIERPGFQQKFIAYVDGLSPIPDLIIVPLHQAALRLAELALPVLRVKRPQIQVIKHSNLLVSNPPQPGDIEAASAIDAVPSDGAILILDDAFITGGRLAIYGKHLRSRSFSGIRHHLVALARPASQERWDHGVRILTWRDQGLDRHTLHAIENLVLPDWNAAQCPWCREARLYRDLAGEQPAEKTAWQNRLEFLDSGEATGLTERLFIPAPGYPDLAFTPGSIFAPIGSSQAAVFAGVAATIQRLRTPTDVSKRPALGRRRFPISTVVDDAEYLDQVYTDSVLRAAFLRAAEPEELIYSDPASEKIRTERAKTLLMSTVATNADLACELLLAEALGQISPLHLSPEELAALSERGIQRFAS